jgi:hypothetical protein
MADDPTMPNQPIPEFKDGSSTDIVKCKKKTFEDAKNAVLAALDSCPVGSSQAEGSPHSFQGGDDAIVNQN